MYFVTLTLKTIKISRDYYCAVLSNSHYKIISSHGLNRVKYEYYKTTRSDKAIRENERLD